MFVIATFLEILLHHSTCGTQYLWGNVRRSYEDPRFQLYEGSDCDKNWERESDKLNVTDVSIHYSISYCASLCAANDLCSAFRYKHPGKKPGETCEHLRAACHVENLENAESASLTFTSYYVKKTVFDKFFVPNSYHYYPGRHCLAQLIGFTGLQYDQSEYFHTEGKRQFHECLSLCDQLEICHGFTYQNVLPMEDFCIIYFQFCSDQDLYEFAHFNYFRKKNFHFAETIGGYELYFAMTCPFAAVGNRIHRKWLNATECATACVYRAYQCFSFATRGVDECYHFRERCHWLDMTSEQEPGWLFYQKKEIPIRGYQVVYNRMMYKPGIMEMRSAMYAFYHLKLRNHLALSFGNCQNECDRHAGQTDINHGVGYGCKGFVFDPKTRFCFPQESFEPVGRLVPLIPKKKANIYLKMIRPPPYDKPKFCVFPFKRHKDWDFLLSSSGHISSSCAKRCHNDTKCLGYLQFHLNGSINPCPMFEKPLSPLELMPSQYAHYYQKRVDGPPVAGFIAIPHQECYAEVLEYFTKFSTVDTVQICGIQCLAMADCYSFTYVPSVKSCQHHSIYCYAKDLMKNCQQNYYQKENLPEQMILEGYEVYANLKCLGSATILNATMDFEGCKWACDQNPNCLSFGFSEHEGRKCEARTYLCPLAALSDEQSTGFFHYNKQTKYRKSWTSSTTSPVTKESDWGFDDDQTIDPVVVITPSPLPFWLKPGQPEIRLWVHKRTRGNARFPEASYMLTGVRGCLAVMSRDRDILDVYWKAVKEDSANFDGWVNLLQAVEQLDDSKKAREAYDSFLKRYPYCYGYWKKYADMEKRHKHPERCLEVYEKGVKAIPLSIDLWIAYVDQYKESVRSSESREKKIRSLYEKAVDAAGLEFRSDKLWENYLTWEIEAKRYRQAMGVWDRLIKTPTYMYSANFDRLQKFVNEHSPEDILSESEYNQLFKDIETTLKEKNAEMYTVEEVQVEIRSEKPKEKRRSDSTSKSSSKPQSSASSKFNRKRKKHRRTSRSDSESSSAGSGEESASTEPPVKVSKEPIEEGDHNSGDHNEQNGNLVSMEGSEVGVEMTQVAEQPQFRTESLKRFSDESLKLFRLKILDKRRKYHLSTEQEVSKRWQYEEQIKRPYFHVKPLERAQLKNWRSYLDFEISVGQRQRITVLFERCLIACALYEDIWIKFARYMETLDGGESAREVYKRACYTHLPKKPNPHLAWSAYEERLGNVTEALRILKDFERDVPGLVQIQLRRIGLMRRQAALNTAVDKGEKVSPAAGSTSASVSYSDVAHTYESIIRDSTYSPRALAFYAIKYARFVAKVRNDRSLAEKILLDAVERDKSNPQLHLQLVDLAYHSQPFSERDMLKAIDRALHQSQMSDTDKLKFSYRKLEFLEDLGSDIKALQDHYEWHLKLCKLVGISGSKKRDDKSSNGDKKSTEVPAAISVAPTIPVAMAPMVPPMGNPYDMYTYGAQGGHAQASWTQPQQQQQQPYGGGYFYPPTY